MPLDYPNWWSMKSVANVAALDCGSNSTRLLISSPSGATLQREMTITRLSQGVDASRLLQEEALERSYQTLHRYRTLMDVHGVNEGLLVATSAVRDAKNGHEFLKMASTITGVEARLLTGDEEARFSYEGATADLPASDTPFMILDIGGGSTELAAKVDGELLGYSMQLGCVRVTERALGKDVVTPERAEAAWSMITEQIDEAFRQVPRFKELIGNVRLVGLAGTVATLAQLSTGVGEYNRDLVHHQTLRFDDVVSWREKLSALTPVERLSLAGMVQGREDVLHAGIFVLQAVMERFGVDQLLTSENDILDGIVASLL